MDGMTFDAFLMFRKVVAKERKLALVFALNNDIMNIITNLEPLLNFTSDLAGRDSDNSVDFGDFTILAGKRLERSPAALKRKKIVELLKYYG